MDKRRTFLAHFWVQLCLLLGSYWLPITFQSMVSTVRFDPRPTIHIV